VRSDDHATARRYDALPDKGTLGGAIGIVFVTAPTIVTIPRPNAEAERADLHASPSWVRAHIDLSGGRNRRNEQSAGCRGQQQIPHDFLLLIAFRPNASGMQALHLEKNF
jgi:hypothetical protein